MTCAICDSDTPEPVTGLPAEHDTEQHLVALFHGVEVLDL